MLPLIDSHCHWDHPRLQVLQPELWQSCLAAGVDQLVVPATKADQFQNQIDLCVGVPHWHLALGLHPYFCDQHKTEHLRELFFAMAVHKPVAVGEIGLDFALDMKQEGFSQSQQEGWFIAQVRLAQQANLPIIVHCRKSEDRLTQLLRQQKFSQGGIMHAFGGSLQQAQALIKLGFKIGLGGSLTYDRAQAKHRLAQSLPLNNIVLETDAPDMPMAIKGAGKEANTESNKDSPNRPDYLPQVLHKLAQLRPESAEDIAHQIYANTLEVLRINS